jgi:membrane protein
MLSWGNFFRRAFRIFARVFPRCSIISQAIAFNLFLAFFPALLIVVGLASTRIGGRTSLFELIRDLTEFLPPGSQTIVSEFLVKRGPDAWKVALIGWTGILIAGSQVMKLVMHGIHIIYDETVKFGFLHRQLRGLALLLITIAPLLTAAILGVLGKPLRHWLAHELGKHNLVLQGWWNIFFPAAAMVLAWLALTVIYRVARPRDASLRNVMPGALVATLLWWAVDVVFGFYVRRVPYSVVYGGLAAVIGLIIWMHLSALIIFLGAAWNAEMADSRQPART